MSGRSGPTQYSMELAVGLVFIRAATDGASAILALAWQDE
jgi:hypothetical protein